MVMASTQSSPHHINPKKSSSRESSSFGGGYFNFDTGHQHGHHHHHQHGHHSGSKPGTPSGNRPRTSSSPSTGLNLNLQKSTLPEVKITMANDLEPSPSRNISGNEASQDSLKAFAELKSPTSPISAATFNMPQRFLNNSNSKSFDISSLNVGEINTLSEFKELKNDNDFDLLIIDTRPFNQYSTSRIQNAMSICVPSTLLKRSSFHLGNIFKTMTIEQQQLINSKLNGTKNLNLLFYDSSSSTKQCSIHLYQILKKFENDIKDYSHSKQTELWFLSKGFTSFLHQEGVSETDTIFDFQKLKSTSNDTNSFSDFILPSANPSSSFLLSMKKNQYTVDSTNSSTKLNIPDFNNVQDSLPTWMQPYLFSNSGDLITRNFIKIENSENARIQSVVSQKTHSPSICSPSCLCPSCDQLNYNLLDGSEHGFKNRYPNILPYEHSRVKLVQSPAMSPGTGTNQNRYFPKVSPSSQHKLHIPTTSPNKQPFEEDDYFNANFIEVPEINKTSRYIATQAPLPSTIDDFWKVVWYNNSEVIVSLTNLSEYGIRKSDVYWTNSKQVKLLDEIENYQGLPNLTVRKIQLEKRGQTKIVRQLHFKDWPDHGVADHNTVLKLSNIKDQFITDKKSPVVVHCSAGCGRTGVFITVDLIINAFKQFQASLSRSLSLNQKNHILNEINTNGELNIWETDIDLIYYTVQQLRKQRISMVQSLNQFIFCYETVLKFFKSLESPSSS